MIPPLPITEDPVHSEVKETVERLRLGYRYRELDGAPEFPREEFRELGRAHLLGLSRDTRLGGRGLPLPRVGSVLYLLGYLAGTTFAKLAMQPEFCGVLGEYGSTDLIERYYRPLLRGELLIGNQITEPGAGSDLSTLATTARRDGSEYRLSGTKTEAAFATEADAAIVYAKVEGPDSGGGVSAFLVPQTNVGIVRTPGDDLGERWMRRGTVVYDQVRIPADHRIGTEGKAFEYVRDELVRDRLLLSCIYLGVARRSWEETIDHVGKRVAFGRPLSDQEAVGFALVEDWVRSDAAWRYVEHALEGPSVGAAESALAKWYAYEVALTCIDHAIQFHGGRGYSKDLPHEQRWRDVRSGGIAHGPSEIMHLVASRALWPRPPASP